MLTTAPLHSFFTSHVVSWGYSSDAISTRKSTVPFNLNHGVGGCVGGPGVGGGVGTSGPHSQGSHSSSLLRTHTHARLGSTLELMQVAVIMTL